MDLNAIFKVRTRQSLAWMLIISSIIFVIIGWGYTSRLTKQITGKNVETLNLIGQYKAREISEWCAEERNDIRTIASNNNLVDDLNEWLETHRTDLKQRILIQLEADRSAHHLKNIFLLAESGDLLLSAVRGDTIGNKSLEKNLGQARSTKQLTISDIYICSIDGMPAFDFIVPVLSPEDSILGFLLYETDPGVKLYPIAKSLPIARKTLQSYIIHKKNDSVELISHSTDSTIRPKDIRDHVSEAGNFFVDVINNPGILIRSKDLSGERVLAVAHPVEGTSWVFVITIDQEEVYAATMSRVVAVAASIMLLMAFTGAGLIILYRTNQKKILEALLSKEQQLSRIGQEYRTVLDSTAEGVILMDTEGIIRRVNPEAEKLTGLNKKEIAGKTFCNILACKNQSEDKSNIIDQVLKGENESEYFKELMIIHESGRAFPIAGSVSPIRNRMNETTGLVMVFRDQTKELQLQNAIAQNEALYRNLNATKDKLFSIIAHDLKNPFNSILGLSEVLMVKSREKDIESIRRYARSIHSASHQAYRLLEDLLDWSFSQAGRLQFTPKRVDLRSTIDHVFSIHQELAAQKEIRLENLVSENLHVLADETMLHTILRNLISNAIKFSNVGGHVWVGIKDEKGYEKNQMVIFVRDNGVGIDMGSAETLFDVGISSRGTVNEKGSGLGLVICREFVEKHSGRIWAVGEPGQGSTFYFSIPKFAKPNNCKHTQTEN